MRRRSSCEDGAKMPLTESRSATPPQDEAQQAQGAHLILLRFPEPLRQQLDAGDQLPQDTTVNERAVASQSRLSRKQRRQQRGRRLLRGVFGVMIFATGMVLAMSVGMLELRLRQVQRKAKLFQVVEKALQKAKASFARGQQPEVYRALPNYLNEVDEAFKRLHHIRQTLCPQVQQATQPKQSQHQALALLRKWQALLWSHARAPYLSARARVFHQPIPSLASLEALCQQKPQKLKEQLQDELWKSSQGLLKQAKLHMKWYNYCRVKWSPYQTNPTHRQWLEKLRQSPCRQRCRRASSSCRVCLRQYRQKLGLSQREFRLYRKLVRQERRGRCLRWNRKPAHEGIFHVGEYYWRVKRVLAYMSLLEGHNACDQRCQTLQKKWGYRLQLRSTPPGASIYLQLWPLKAKAPTTLLKQINRKRVAVADGRARWFPAFVSKGEPPRDLWALLELFDEASKKRAFLPFYPVPGGTWKETIPLAKQEVYNDGRQPVRLGSFSRQGKWLAFATYRLMPWEQAPAFERPYCWKSPALAPTTHSWRASVSLYAIGRDGRTDPRKGTHHLLTHWPRELRLSEAEPHPQLFISTPGLFAKNKLTPAARQASLWHWETPQTSTTGGAPLGLRAVTQLQRSGAVDLPLHDELGRVLVLRLSCDDLFHPLTLMQIPATALPPQVVMPAEQKLIHAARSGSQLALLLHTKTIPPKAELRVYQLERDRTPLVKVEKLPHLFRQLRATEGGFFLAAGPMQAPLMRYTAKGLETLLKGAAHARYLDPTFHRPSRSLFFVRQREIKGTTARVTFLLSQKQPEDRR